MDPRAKQLKTIRSMKDAELRHRAWQMIKVGERYQDRSTRGTSRTDGEQKESRADAGLTVDREQRAGRKRTVVVRDNGRLAG